MPSDHHESPPDGPAADEHDDESSSIGDSSLFAPPTSHRHLHPHPFPQSDPQGFHSFVEAHDPSVSLSATAIFASTAAPSGPRTANTYPEYSEDLSLPNPHPHSPLPSWLLGHGRTPPPLPNIVPAPQPLVSPGGYAPPETLPPQNYISPARTMPRLIMPFYPPPSHGTSVLSAATPTHGVPSPTAVVPPNSELARPPRFTFAPPGAHVPADPVISPTEPSPASGRRRDKERPKGKTDKASQLVAEGSGRRTRSNSWSVVSSVFRRRSGRHSGPPPLTTTVIIPPRLADSDWRDLAKWAHRPCDDRWGESFDEHGNHAGANFPAEPEPGLSLYERQLPPLPPQMSHLSVPRPPLGRPDTSTSALNPFLAHRPVGVPPLAWDLRAGARAILFPSAAGGGPALPMAASDYAQPATWPPCGALRIGAIGEHAGWRWPVEVYNPVGVRCGDVFRALVANLHEFVGAREIASMPPERVAVIAAACTARVAAGLPPGSAANDGIRRVDCLLGCTQFHGLEPGPSTGEWTMYVGAL